MKHIKPLSSGSSLHFREKPLRVPSCYAVRQSLPHERGGTRVSHQPLSPHFIRMLTELPRQKTSSNSTSSSLPEEPVPGNQGRSMDDRRRAVLRQPTPAPTAPEGNGKRRAQPRPLPPHPEGRTVAEASSRVPAAPREKVAARPDRPALPSSSACASRGKPPPGACSATARKENDLEKPRSSEAGAERGHTPLPLGHRLPDVGSSTAVTGRRGPTWISGIRGVPCTLTGGCAHL